MNDLNARQRTFVTEYVVGKDAHKAALAAGYSAKTAGVTGAKMVRIPKVAQAIETALKKLEVRSEITQTRVLNELALLVFSDVTHYVMDDDGNVTLAEGAPPAAMRAVSSIKRKVHYDGKGNVIGRDCELRLWDKPGPLKLAGRHVGLFPSKDTEQMKAMAEELLKAMIAKAREQRANAATAEEPKGIETTATAAGGVVGG